MVGGGREPDGKIGRGGRSEGKGGSGSGRLGEGEREAGQEGDGEGVGEDGGDREDGGQGDHWRAGELPDKAWGGNEKGFCPERTVKVERKGNGEVSRVSVEYHLTEPERVSASEKRKLVELVVELVGRIEEALPGVQTLYLTMFPRFLERCCRAENHMSKKDSVVINGFRKAVDSDVAEEMEEMGVQVIEWYDLLGWESEPRLAELLRKDVVCNDGVHLTSKANSFAAVSLCCRIAEVELLFVKSVGKRRRMD